MEAHVQRQNLRYGNFLLISARRLARVSVMARLHPSCNRLVGQPRRSDVPKHPSRIALCETRLGPLIAPRQTRGETTSPLDTRH
jgi:hypothetical protein